MDDWLTSEGEDGDIWIGLNDHDTEDDFVWAEDPDTVIYDDGAAGADPPQTSGGITTYW